MSGENKYPPRTLEVLGGNGVGKSTLMGNLLYKCGGVDPLVLEKLQKAGIHKYDQVVDYFVENSLELSFQSKRFTISFTHTSVEAEAASTTEPADCTLYIIDAESIQLKETTGELGTNIDWNDRQVRKLVVAVNKMDMTRWSEEIYAKAAKAAASTLKGLGVDPENTPMIPISALCGDNLLEPSMNTPWFPGKALIDAIDLLTAIV